MLFRKTLDNLAKNIYKDLFNSSRHGLNYFFNNFNPCSGLRFRGCFSRKEKTMRRYETVFIIDPDASAEQRTAILDRVNGEIEKYQGVLLQFDEWGLRKMAYPVRKKPRGYYVLCEYCADKGELISEIERFFRIDDNVMKYMTVQTSDDTDPETAKAEIEAKKNQVPPEPDTVEAQTVEETKAGEPEMNSGLDAGATDTEAAEDIDEEDE